MSRCTRLGPVVSEQTQPASHDAPSSPAVRRLETSGLDRLCHASYQAKSAIQRRERTARLTMPSHQLHGICDLSDSWLLIFFLAVFLPIDRQEYLVSVSSDPILLLARLFNLLECRMKSFVQLIRLLAELEIYT